MLIEQKHILANMLGAAARAVCEPADPDALAFVAALDALASLSRPKQPDHGDWASNLALQIAKPLKRNPKQIAQSILAKLIELDDSRLIARHEIAGPGFINLWLTEAAKREVISAVLRQGPTFGHHSVTSAPSVLVEFVSANPTGPLHVGHGRQAALGDALSTLLQAAGAKVTREFYYNDAGAQIDNLARSVQARGLGIEPGTDAFPADGYRGDYIIDIAAQFVAKATVSAEHVPTVTANGDLNDLAAIRAFAVAFLRQEQDLDLQAFGVRFDHYYLESSLHVDGKVNAVIDALISTGDTFEDGGALWLRSTSYGDDKDRVMRKSEGGFTYFVPDVAYHVTKWQRGFSRAINIQGSDHHGSIARVRAGLQALQQGIPAQYPEYLLHKMVTVMKDGQEVKISKRAGGYVTLRDLIEWSGGGDDLQRGRDAVRFFLLSRKPDTEFVFDVDLALARSDENPVYYVQYAHARICAVFAQWIERFGVEDGVSANEISAPAVAARLSQVDLSPLTRPREFALMALLAELPSRVLMAVEDLSPHSIVFYLKDLAAEVHSYYNAERFLVEEAGLRCARMALLAATRQVLSNALALLGVSAPEKM